MCRAKGRSDSFYAAFWLDCDASKRRVPFPSGFQGGPQLAVDFNYEGGQVLQLLGVVF